MQLIPLAILACCAATNAATTRIHLGSDPGGPVAKCGGIPLAYEEFDPWPADVNWQRCWSVPHGAGHYVYWENKPPSAHWHCEAFVYNDNRCTSKIGHLAGTEDCAYTSLPIYSYGLYCNPADPPSPPCDWGC
ncbi:hypothetical protein EJ03DRAFT_18433 [Teratosphaeria nubilosa]|uniref:Secreted protein n=1 Tax=Teratosphaeria nubilosa TaxID=161662 RepID=A0A6G1KW71_9PEZI|nr:hypothetical protein EJ03DRAFT_18433 [Teratosphaeria nubilosa]